MGFCAKFASVMVRAKNIIIHRDLGTIPYDEALATQEEIFLKLVQNKIENREKPASLQNYLPNYILTCEHTHVYTLGKSGDKQHLLLDAEGLRAQNVSFFETNRGGDITYHGPGQLVVYPILDLEHFFTDIHKYLRYLEETVIQTLYEFQIVGERIEGFTGVWVGKNSSNPRKICAMGVRTSRWVTMHGLALNINPQLSFFNHIVPCGISDKAVTSMEAELGTKIDSAHVTHVFLKNFVKNFACSLEKETAPKLHL